jgi:hypothetical protein
VIAPAPANTDLKSALEEMRASADADAERNGLARLVAAALVRLLDLLVALVADFRAGTLVPANADGVWLEEPGAAVEEAPAAAPVAADAEGTPGAGWRGLWAWWHGKSDAGGHAGTHRLGGSDRATAHRWAREAAAASRSSQSSVATKRDTVEAANRDGTPPRVIF